MEQDIGTQSRDDSYSRRVTWDDLGIELAIDDDDNKTVIEMTIYINLEPPDPYAGLVTQRSDGTPIKPSYDSRPKKPFSGYLELDHAGIDAETKFWEIREQVDPNRNLHCSWEDCAHPDGSFNDTADLFLRLNRGDEYGELYELAIGGQAKSLKAALRSKK